MTRDQLEALAQRVVDTLPDPTPEQCRRVAAVLESAKEADGLLTRNEVAERLGVSTRWLMRNAANGPSHYRLPGGAIRYKESDLKNWLRQRRIA